MIASPRALPRIDDDEVHVWVAETGGPMDSAGIAQLSADEHDRADRYRFDRDRRCFMFTRIVTRRLLAGYLGETDPAALVIGYGERGKPHLERPPRALFFNASHSGEHAAIAITRAGDVGIDIESVDRDVEADQLAARVFSARELAAFEAQPEPTRRAVFFDGWTRKEAFIKATGEGMWRSLQSVDVEIGPGAPVRVLAVDGDEREAACWTLAAFDPAPGYIGAIAVRARAVRVQRLDWGAAWG